MTTWMPQARCTTVDAELFFPVAEAGPELDSQVRAAKSVCLRCAVRRQCLDWALTELPDGVAGGLTPEERRGVLARRVRRNRGAA